MQHQVLLRAFDPDGLKFYTLNLSGANIAGPLINLRVIDVSSHLSFERINRRLTTGSSEYFQEAN